VVEVWDRVLVEELERIVLGNCELEASRAAATESSLKLKLADLLVTSVASTNFRVNVSVVDSAGGVQTYEVPVNALPMVTTVVPEASNNAIVTSPVAPDQEIVNGCPT